MSEFNLFDASKLTDEEIGHLEWVLNSPSYERVFRLYLKKMIESVQTYMLDRSEDRKKLYPDDFLAGQAAGLIGLLRFLDGLRDHTNMARVDRAQQATPNEAYEKLRALGAIRHSGQAVNPEDLEIAEDF
jgi:hypothetical protein